MVVLASPPIFSPAHWKARSNFLVIFMVANLCFGVDDGVGEGNTQSADQPVVFGVAVGRSPMLQQGAGSVPQCVNVNNE